MWWSPSPCGLRTGRSHCYSWAGSLEQLQTEPSRDPWQEGREPVCPSSASEGLGGKVQPWVGGCAELGCTQGTAISGPHRALLSHQDSEPRGLSAQCPWMGLGHLHGLRGHPRAGLFFGGTPAALRTGPQATGLLAGEFVPMRPSPLLPGGRGLCPWPRRGAPGRSLPRCLPLVFPTTSPLRGRPCHPMAQHRALRT